MMAAVTKCEGDATLLSLDALTFQNFHRDDDVTYRLDLRKPPFVLQRTAMRSNLVKLKNIDILSYDLLKSSKILLREREGELSEIQFHLDWYLPDDFGKNF